VAFWTDPIHYCLRLLRWLTNKKALADKRGRWRKIGGFGGSPEFQIRYCGLSKLNLMKQRKIETIPKTALRIPLCVGEVGGKQPRFSHTTIHSHIRFCPCASRGSFQGFSVALSLLSFISFGNFFLSVSFLSF